MATTGSPSAADSFPLKRRSWRTLALVALAVCGLAVIFVRDPAASRLFPPCPFRALTGLCCPGCGTLRGLHQLLHGNLVAAFWLNPLMVLTLPVVAYCLLGDLAAGAFGFRLPRMRCGAAPVWILLGVIVAFWLLRNLPWYPFSLLAA